LSSDSGHSGVAELTLKPTWTGATCRSLVAIIQDAFLPILQQTDLADVTDVRSALNSIPQNLAAKSLIDNALWDLKAASTKTPLWQMWHGTDTVDLSWAVTRRRPKQMAAEAERVVAEYGFRTLKIKGGQSLETDVEALKAIKHAVGDAVSFYVDANGYYSTSEAVQYVNAMADMVACVVEDPCTLLPDASFTELQQMARVPVLVDSNCRSLVDAHAFIDRGA